MSLVVLNEERPGQDWDAIIPLIFTDPRFKPAGRRRKLICLNGVWAGFVLAFRPSSYANFGLNQEDVERLFEKIADGSLDLGFIVQAAVENGKPTYIAHRKAEEVYVHLKDVPPRDGPHGPFWLLAGTFQELDDLAEAMKRFG